MLKNDIRRYNPFFGMFDDLDSDKFYEDESAEFVESIEQQSKILEDCKNYTCKKLSELVKNDRDKYRNFSSIFMNIDGNKSNFDSFTTELHRIDHKFSVVALAETNIDSCSCVYHLILGER